VKVASSTHFWECRKCRQELYSEAEFRRGMCDFCAAKSSRKPARKLTRREKENETL
jgi:hypothetical protein